MPTAFGDLLRKLREAKGLTLNEASQLAGIDKGLWSRYETGKRRPPNPGSKVDGRIVIRKISDVLKTNEYDPYGDFSALATLPENSPGELVKPLSYFYTRQRKIKPKK